MRLVVVGSAREITGFALAGVETVACEPCDDPATVISDLARADAAVGVVVVSASAARAAAAVIRTLRRRKGPPVITELPATTEEPPP